MAKKTRTELSTLAINTNLPDNTTELITPTTERAQLTDERESVVNYKDDLGGVPNAGKFLTVAVDGESLTMVDAPTGDVTGTGTQYQLAVWDGTSALTGYAALTYINSILQAPELRADSTNGTVTINATDASGGTAWLYFQNASVLKAEISYFIQDDFLTIRTYQKDIVFERAVNTPTLTIDGTTGDATFSSSVGIGTDDPVKTLDVRGQLAISNSASSYWYMDRNGAGNFQIIDDANNPAITIDTSRNVGIGTDSPAYLLTASGTNLPYIASVTDNVQTVMASDEINGRAYIGTRTDHPIAFVVNGNEKMRISSGGDVGIGTNSPVQPLQLGDVSVITQDINSMYVGVNFGGSTNGTYIKSQYANQIHFDSAAGQIKFRMAGSGATAGDNISYSTAMRIISTGELLKGITTAVGQGTLADSNSTEIGNGYMNLCRDDTATIKQIRFGKNGSEVGSISTTGTATSYNTSSDYRLKENVTPITDALSRINQLKPSRFNFIADADKTVDGFLAHEVQNIIPEAISGEKDAMRDEEFELTPRVEEVIDEEGNVITEAVQSVMETRSVPNYQGIDQSKIVPLLTAAIQEQQTIIADLITRLEALEA